MDATRLAIGAAFLVFSAWTMARLWRPAHDPYTRTVYLFGVKGFGLTTFVISTALRIEHDRSYEALSFPIVFLDLFSSLALSMWFGYLWGRAMAWAFRDRLQ